MQLIEVTTLSSREIAELTGKRHDHVLRDIDILNEYYVKMAFPKVGESSYRNEQGREFREILLSKMQSMDLMTGYKIELRIKVNRRWEELEKKNNQLDFSNPDTVLLLAQNWKNERDRANNLQLEIKEQEPMVIFAKALQVSNHSILVGELAKILKQNKIEIGQNRLFDWLRENSYLMSRGEQKNLPTQKSLELDLFEVKTTTIANPDGSVRVTKTTKIKPKGQEYFVNKFLKQKTFLA